MGSGPAGLTALLFAARAQLQPLLITGSSVGGQLTRTSVVKNWPGISSIDGTELTDSLFQHAQEYPCQWIEEKVSSVSLTPQTKTIALADGSVHEAAALIIACGTTPRTLQCPGATEQWERGIFTTPQTHFTSTKEKPLLIVGGGNSAIGFADELLRKGHFIVIAQNGATLTATDPRRTGVMQAAVIRYHTLVEAVHTYDAELSYVTLYNTAHQTRENLAVSAILVATGAEPNTSLFRGQLALEQSGHIKVEAGTTHTSMPGVFAAGDVADSRYRHAITSSGQGAMAALDAERYLNGRVVVRFF